VTTAIIARTITAARNGAALRQTARVMHEMGCAELVEVVTDYLENALDGEQRRRFEAHVAGCDGCEEYLKQYRATILALGSADEPRLPEGLQRELHERFRRRRTA
jgi:anti-sigma factor RsiW